MPRSSGRTKRAAAAWSLRRRPSNAPTTSSAPARWRRTAASPQLNRPVRSSAAAGRPGERRPPHVGRLDGRRPQRSVRGGPRTKHSDGLDRHGEARRARSAGVVDSPGVQLNQYDELVSRPRAPARARLHQGRLAAPPTWPRSTGLVLGRPGGAAASAWPHQQLGLRRGPSPWPASDWTDPDRHRATTARHAVVALGAGGRGGGPDVRRRRGDDRAPVRRPGSAPLPAGASPAAHVSAIPADWPAARLTWGSSALPPTRRAHRVAVNHPFIALYTTLYTLPKQAVCLRSHGGEQPAGGRRAADTGRACAGGQ